MHTYARAHSCAYPAINVIYLEFTLVLRRAEPPGGFRRDFPERKPNTARPPCPLGAAIGNDGRYNSTRFRKTRVRSFETNRWRRRRRVVPPRATGVDRNRALLTPDEKNRGRFPQWRASLRMNLINHRALNRAPAG